MKPGTKGQQGGESFRPRNMPRVKSKKPGVRDAKLMMDMVQGQNAYAKSAITSGKPDVKGRLLAKKQFGVKNKGVPPHA